MAHSIKCRRGRQWKSRWLEAKGFGGYGPVVVLTPEQFWAEFSHRLSLSVFGVCAGGFWTGQRPAACVQLICLRAERLFVQI